MGAAPKGDRARRRAGATALTAAVIGGILGGVPATQASAAPGPGDRSAGATDQEPQNGEKARGGSLPPVWPRPQSMRQRDGFVAVGREATVVADEDTDPAALDALRAVLRDAGARDVRQVRPGQQLPRGGGLVVRVDSATAPQALAALKAPPRGDLPRGGYRLAAGRTDKRSTVALEGADADGLFHAVQTLRQLVTERDGGRGFAGVTVRDWPTAPVRGITEGFYGSSWTQRQRLEQLDFLGRTKQNRYLYASTDDPYRQSSRWRDPYPAAQRDEFRELADRARRNHVKLGWAVAPGQGMCFSSGADRRALLRKLDAMRALGFEAFQLRFEDVSYSEWHCDEDAQKYGSGAKAAARAHAELANDVARHLAERHRDAEPLSVMPTEFYQGGGTEYRDELAGRLDPGVQVAWTGVGVVPRTITGGELTAVREAFHQHPLVTMDNYPVNDYAQDRIFLGPYRGREPAVAARSAAVLTNAMKQPAASRIPLFTAADYAWNPKGYDPQRSWQAAIDEAAGGDAQAREAVGALAGNDASSVLGNEESAYLRPLLKDFWAAYDASDPQDRDSLKRLRRTAGELRGAFHTMRTAQDRVPGALAGEVRPWLEELARHGEAGEQAVRMLSAQARGDGGEAWDARLAVERLHARDKDPDRPSATVGKGVLKDFVKRSLKASDAWTGADHRGTGRHRATAEGGPAARPDSPAKAAVDGDPDTAYRAEAAPATGYFAPRSPLPGASLPGGLGRGSGSSGGAGGPWDGPGEGQGGGRGQGSGGGSGQDTPALTVRLPEQRPLDAVTVQTGPGSGTRARVEAHVPGEGWRRLGPLSGSGWTQRDAHGLRADALRLAWSPGSDEPVVHEITPWYADRPDASLSLTEDDVYAPIGGGTGRTAVELHGHVPSDVRGRVTAEAPDGFTVRTPRRTVVPRGGRTEVPVEIEADSSVKSGSHRITLHFGEDEKRTLTVRAFPRTGGPDLARDAEATSSGDETGDFPASAVNDGREDTRWSSPAKDGEWVQLKLRDPARLGELVLHWQDAYAKRYRVQVSPDGKRWREAASVRDGKGGKETVRMDAPRDTRYVRVQGDERATRFGLSLWSLQAYAVKEGAGRDR
ncbi:beta-N-acetylglucosaminidase domain-containing protein [Streptomyces marispadix]|uniref:Beta-N-acetylglucosaminidase domain-containing protein n=1 Tax=Streptomyces marispadix TaxID=2922868 RepID=A0ABS9SW86_9ACTN|nr:beta-N-acetylglucosaminidase domain-containing protein [Streptomyces marispadix]MCH6160311.1 beta-N-acetylglucosaminidase domain-containing protein [Streptomyces marispadix]